VKRELADDLRGKLREHAIGATADDRTSAPERPIDPLAVLRALGRAVDYLITDATHRRADVQDLVDEQARTQVRLAVLETSDGPGPFSAGTPWLWAAAAATVGAVVALHALELAALAALWWTR